MNTTRRLTLAALLLGLVAVAPANASDASKADLQNALRKTYHATVHANGLAQQVSSKYGGLKIQVVNSTKQSSSIVKGLHAELQKPGPLDLRRLLHKAKQLVRQLEFAIEMADRLEEETDDRDDDTNEDKAESIRRDLKRARSQVRDFIRLID